MVIKIPQRSTLDCVFMEMRRTDEDERKRAYRDVDGVIKAESKKRKVEERMNGDDYDKNDDEAHN